MTPEELRTIALEATKKEYESIVAEIKKEAQKGSFSCTFDKITDGALEQLKKASFDLQQRQKSNSTPGHPSYYWDVSFKPRG